LPHVATKTPIINRRESRIFWVHPVVRYSCGNIARLAAAVNHMTIRLLAKDKGRAKKRLV